MRLNRVRSLVEFEAFRDRNEQRNSFHMRQIHEWAAGKNGPFTVPGYSYTAKMPVDFMVDFEHALEGGRVNWRERAMCPVTAFNNRMRATIHIADIELNLYDDSRIYITEQVTPMFRYYKQNFPLTVGSEYLGGSVPFGSTTTEGVRNEDLTRLTFESGSFDTVICLDVLEHIPNFEAAFAECARILRPGGVFMWSVPFNPAAQKNLTRAEIVGGVLHHIHPPEYHGNPVSEGGSLCFTHFGWESLEMAQDNGFSSAYAICVQSLEYGYFGEVQIQFIAKKGASTRRRGTMKITGASTAS